MAKVAVILLSIIALVQADMYLHNPRGSNNRLDEAKRERNNANRMFDSQNNNRGGYNVGNLYYYEGSILPIEWTNQHSCGDQNNHCEIIIQYMCGAHLRDGASTGTIPVNRVQCENYDCNTDLEYGMHESYDYYLSCANRERNQGLFTADRNLQGTNARYTRQNNNGNRRGYECPEERDYYPYWHPTPWIDIAILTNDPTRCPYYRRESENIKARYYCRLPAEYLRLNLQARRRNYIIPNNQDECEQWNVNNPITGESYGAAFWTAIDPPEGLSEPECVESLWSRDNHLGNSVGGFPNYYNWTIPDTIHENCALRIRYNISTGDYDAWDDPSINGSLTRRAESVLTAQNNQQGVLRMRNTQISPLDVYSKFGFDFETAKERGYVFRQNPTVQIFPDISETAENFALQLAINTNQFGRTFEDRSHAFEIRARPEELQDVNIYNLNVRGKRGNIVQVYPGVEYDFVPNRLEIEKDAHVHIQWTGSNTNPRNNDGQGLAGTDRSNVVLQDGRVYDEVEGTQPEDVNGHWGRSYPSHLSDADTFLGFSREERQRLAFLIPNQYGGEMSELDDAGTYFDLGPQAVTQVGTYYYMCSRNNNFSNRSQKGKIVVRDNLLVTNRLGWNGGMVTADESSLTFSQGDLTVPQMVIMEEFQSHEDALNAFNSKGPSGRKRQEESSTACSTSPPGDVQSTYIVIYTDTDSDILTPNTQNEVTISLKLDGAAPAGTRVFISDRSNPCTFRELDTTVNDGMATAMTNEEGVYVAAAPLIAAYVTTATAVVVIVVVLIAVVGLIVYFRVRKDKWERVKSSFSGVGRNFQKKV